METISVSVKEISSEECEFLDKTCETCPKENCLLRNALEEYYLENDYLPIM